MNWHGVIAFEGRLSVDGRIIDPGWLTWPGLPVPLRVAEAGGAVFNIGTVDTVHRYLDVIVASGTFDDEINMIPILERVEMGTMQIPVGIEIDPDGRLACLFLADVPAWPAARITLDMSAQPKPTARKPGRFERVVVRALNRLADRIDALTEKALERKLRR